jgi:hypothetical protein
MSIYWEVGMNGKKPFPFLKQNEVRHGNSICEYRGWRHTVAISVRRFAGVRHWFTRVIHDKTVEDFANDLTVNASVVEEYRYMFPKEVAARLGLETFAPLQLKPTCYKCHIMLEPSGVQCSLCLQKSLQEPVPAVLSDSDSDDPDLLQDT